MSSCAAVGFLPPRPADPSSARACATEESSAENFTGLTPAARRTVLIRSTSASRVSWYWSGAAAEKTRSRAGRQETENAKRLKSALRLPPPAYRVQRLLQIGDQVGDVLDADGDPHEPGGDTQAGALRFRDRGVRHRRGVGDQSLAPAEALAQGAEPHRREKTARGVVGAELEGDHGAEPAHLFLRERVLRVVGKARVVDLLDLRVRGEEPSDLAAVRLVALHAHRESLDAPQHEPGVERRED